MMTEPTMRFQCPRCGPVSVPVSDVVILLPGGNVWPRFSASCNQCDLIVAGEVNRAKTQAIIKRMVQLGHPPINLPPQEIGETLTLDYAIDLHEDVEQLPTQT